MMSHPAHNTHLLHKSGQITHITGNVCLCWAANPAFMILPAHTPPKRLADTTLLAKMTSCICASQAHAGARSY